MKRLHGFTLIEMIMVIVIIGIIAGMVAVFIARPVEGYVDSVRRAGMTDVADLALKRMALEIRTAVPNSVQVTSNNQIEFVPARTGGRYCTDLESGCNPLTFGTAGDSFSVLGPVPTDCASPATVTVARDDSVVIYNTGQSGLDVYAANESRRRVSGAALNGSTLTPSANAQCADTITLDGPALTYASPSNRFQLVPRSGPVMFRCAGNELRRYENYGWDHDVATGASINNSLLASATTPLTCNFRYEPVNAANGLVSLSLTINNAGESITLLHQIHVDNMP